MPTTTQNFVIPTSFELEYINQIYMGEMAGKDPIDEIFPPVSRDVVKIVWEQEDFYSGMTQARGLGGTPLKVDPVGMNQYEITPGYYGEFNAVDETEMTLRRKYGSINEPIDVQDLVFRRKKQLMIRQENRRKWLGWQLLLKGTFSVAHPATRAICHTDSYTQRTYAPTTLWSDHANSTPLQDMRNMQLLSRGYSVKFDSTSTLWLQRVDVNNMLANTNAADLGSRRTFPGIMQSLTLEESNRVFSGEGLPTIRVWDEGWYSDGKDGYTAGTFNQDIPVGTGALVGKRTDGSPIGRWIYTRNMVNPGGTPGPYSKVKERDEVPPVVEVHQGFSGGHMLAFPSAIIIVGPLS